jgi:hypothetical protein
MQTWATLAAKHATLTSGIGLGAIPAVGWDSLDGVAVGALLAGVGFAVLNSPRRAQSCQLPPTMYDRGSQAQTSRPAGGRLARVRRRVDGVLTGMLSDDSDRMTSAPATWQDEAHDEAQDEAAAEQSPAAAARPDLTAGQLMPAPTAADAEELMPAKTATGAEQLVLAMAADAEIDAAGSGASAPTNGYRSKHRLDAPASSATPPGSRRTGPRHAAPPAGLGAALSRGLTSPRLTSRSAAHAGG